jgi:integrase
MPINKSHNSPLKKQNFSDEEVNIFDGAVIYKRGEYWQMRMWLTKEHRYARFSLRTKSKDTATEKAKMYYHELMAKTLAGKTYFSKTTKQGVDEYLKQRAKDVEAELIVKGRLSTIKTHLNHFLDFIGRDTKLKELERTDCENYYLARTKTKKQIAVSQSTVENEQSTINAMLAWLYKRNEAYIENFDFKKLKRIDKGAEENRRSSFTDDELDKIRKIIATYTKEAEQNITSEGNLIKAITGYYLGVAINTGLRTGEQMQLRWGDIEDLEDTEIERNNRLTKITVRGETSKVRRTRKFVIRDNGGYFNKLCHLTRLRYEERRTELEITYEKFIRKQNEFIFSKNGNAPITKRAISYHFDKILELAEIKNISSRNLVPYSFRHYFITQRVNSNLPPASVAEMCGTSISQIEKTYYHTTHDKMVSNALTDYTIKNGLLIPK